MKQMKQFLERYPLVGAICAALLIIPTVSMVAYSAVTQIAGLAAAGPNNAWYNVKDAGKWSDPQTTGFLSQVAWLFTGTNFVKQRGNSNGSAIVTVEPSGTAFSTIKHNNIAAASVNIAFGFTSKKVAIEFPLTNTDEVCVDWLGGTAVCPAANTAGDDRFLPGDVLILDEFAVTSLSFIASSGTQTVYVRAWQ